MWEILNECEKLPFYQFSNAQILKNVQNILKQLPNAVIFFNFTILKF